MARGNDIVVSPFPKGHRVEGIIGAGLTPKPGTIMQLQPATALVGGRHTWELYNGDADGGRPKGPIIVLTPDFYQGRTATDAYAAGERAFGYIPLPGDELNLLVANLTGTGDDHTKGETLIISTAADATQGKMLATASTPETEVAQLLETITDPLADTLAWCIWTGY
jgi:hypothetical protein